MTDIYLYIPEALREKLVWFNDAFFNEEVFRVIQPDDKVCDIIKQIDGSETMENWFIKTKYGNGIDMTYLSTGCKTAINAYLFRDHLINISECGINAVQEILLLDGAKVYTEGLPGAVNNFSGDFSLHREGLPVSRYKDYFSLCDGEEMLTE